MTFLSVILQSPSTKFRSSALGAPHLGFDPRLLHLHELVVGQRGRRAACAGLPGPEDEWIDLHMLDDVRDSAAWGAPWPSLPRTILCAAHEGTVRRPMWRLLPVLAAFSRILRTCGIVSA